jgi:hypothetical protein
MDSASRSGVYWYVCIVELTHHRPRPFYQAKYISICMDECRKELKAGNIDAKANAVSKLCYVCSLSLPPPPPSTLPHPPLTLSSSHFTRTRVSLCAAHQLA